MSEANKALIRRFYEELENKGNLQVVDEIVAPDFVDVYNTAAPFPIRGREGIKNLAKFLHDALDLHITIDDLIAEGDKVVARFTSRITHKSEIMGVPPTGKQFTGAGVEIFRIVNGQIKERWVFVDQTAMWRELGLLGPRKA